MLFIKLNNDTVNYKTDTNVLNNVVEYNFAI